MIYAGSEASISGTAILPHILNSSTRVNFMPAILFPCDIKIQHIIYADWRGLYFTVSQPVFNSDITVV